MNSTTRAADQQPCRRSPLWDATRSSSSAFFGTTSLPSDVPSKAACTNALHSLPLKPSIRQVSEVATLFQFRKTMQDPVLEKESFDILRSQLSRPAQRPHIDFQHAALLAISLLPRNWDSAYLKNVDLTVPTLSSNLESVKLTSLPMSSSIHFQAICQGRSPTIPIPRDRKFQCFPDGGKTRSVTIASILQLQLAPLSATLYDALVKTGAVLKGTPTPVSLAGFTTSPTEVFVSADYKGSTNNFLLSNTDFLIRALQRTSTRIPPAIWDLLADFMRRPHITSAHGSFDMSNGQLMGDRPSFPLLCLTNLVGVVCGLGLVRTKELLSNRLLKINGDDIAFRCRPDEYRTWAARLPLAGLLLEENKTLVHPRVLTLNSTYWTTRPSKRPRAVWFFNAQSLLRFSPSRGTSRKKHSAQYQASRLASFLEKLALWTKGLHCPAVHRLRHHLYRSRHHIVTYVDHTLRFPESLPTDRLPGCWRRIPRALDEFKGLTMKGATPEGHPPPPPRPVAGYSISYIRPADAPGRRFHRQVEQILSFRRPPGIPDVRLALPVHRDLRLQPACFRSPSGAPLDGMNYLLRSQDRSLSKWSPVVRTSNQGESGGLGWKKKDEYFVDPSEIDPAQVRLPEPASWFKTAQRFRPAGVESFHRWEGMFEKVEEKEEEKL
uniref:RNA-dependent RNA polymerase n=1 Tax=Lentinula edodes magoulivirus 2 TaxID=2992852 RepID=A0A9E7V8B9_9VIRU|nr:RNA-dependent RNA polymerase [Lentinula edodes magoulivirus 2]